MNTKTTNFRIDEKIVLKIVLVIFIGCVFLLPLLQMYLSVFPEYVITENRRLAFKPKLEKFTIFSVESFLKNYEKYFNDNFGFRNYLIRLNSFVALSIFNSSPSPNVVIGKKGWLFYNSLGDGVSLPDFYGKTPYSDFQIDAIKNHLLFLNHEFKKRNILFLLVLVPNKHTIYPELLPDRIQKIKGQYTRADQIHELLFSNDLNYIDLRQTLLEGKSTFSYPIALTKIPFILLR